MLTNPQLLALKAAILADANITEHVAAGATGYITEYLKTNSTFVVWKSLTRSSDIYDAITWSALTPNDIPDGTTFWTNRALMCQAKQLNLQILIQGRDSVSSDKTTIRNGFADALQNVPSGPAGALQNAGWLAVKAVMYRFASRFEKIYSTGTGTSATPGSLVLEGGPQEYDVVQALTQV